MLLADFVKKSLKVRYEKRISIVKKNVACSQETLSGAESGISPPTPLPGGARVIFLFSPMSCIHSQPYKGDIDKPFGVQ